MRRTSIGGGIDWEAVRGRLRKSEEALRETLPENPARMKAVFRQRAIQLAKRRDTGRPISAGIPVLVFRLAEERYAIALGELSEVLPFRGCTAVPGSRPQILGVIPLRGELRPVIDLANILTGSSSTGSGAVLVLRRQGALKADGVEELREIRSDEALPRVQGQYCRALTSGTLRLLDVEATIEAVFSTVECRSV